ncbi:MAG: Triosephosphate isomerase [Candidatus Uhrbacteria bacterium GW2011_GWE2_40_58]|nr:MAG: Triosephosphate isomerase [Candidatus Uhrbacteria bacterium GW2011_GWF2_40_263]KKR67346.1 MAG: Triosephosphate isomerase [Candidatus Uhrbacteria bacterium GW2011_GWE2_40_58]
MNVGVRESVALARGVLYALRGKSVVPEVVICPSFIALSEVRKITAKSRIALGSQNSGFLETGALTGEISVRQLEELGVSHVILGHSERRQLLGETNEMIQKKLALAVKHQLIPILCVGETREEREQGKAKEVVIAQVKAMFAEKISFKKFPLFFAYEPIWAIGTGKAATPADAVEMHQVIRQTIKELVPSFSEKQVSILYGGSIDSKNAYAFLREQEVDGVLVGGASVKLSQMREIIDAASDALESTLSLT